MKTWYRQRSTWTGITSLVGGLVLCFTGEWKDGADLIAIGISTIFLREGMKDRHLELSK